METNSRDLTLPFSCLFYHLRYETDEGGEQYLDWEWTIQDAEGEEVLAQPDTSQYPRPEDDVAAAITAYRISGPAQVLDPDGVADGAYNLPHTAVRGFATLAELHRAIRLAFGESLTEALQLGSIESGAIYAQAEGSLKQVAAAWAAAAGHAGAFAPKHVMEVLVLLFDEGNPSTSIFVAMIVGTRRAQVEHDEVHRTGPNPRGLDLSIGGGRVSRITWVSDSHDVGMWPIFYGASGIGRWGISIRYDGPGFSQRIQSARSASPDLHWMLSSAHG